jgi:hypothetical protein
MPVYKKLKIFENMQSAESLKNFCVLKFLCECLMIIQCELRQ